MITRSINSIEVNILIKKAYPNRVGLFRFQNQMGCHMLEKSIQKIEAALRNTGKSEITGALLGELIRREVRDLNLREVTGIHTGPGALRKFIEQHLTHCLTRKGNQGSDPVYEIQISGGDAAAEFANQNLWLAFVRTGASEQIFIDSESHTFEVKKSHQEVPDGKLLIENATEQELNNIRTSFVDELALNESELADQLKVTLPYAIWSNELKKVGRHKVKAWSDFRIKKITELFASRLAKLGFEDGIAKKLCQELRDSQNAAHAASLAHRNSFVSQKEAAPTVSADKAVTVNSISLRDTVVHAVKSMSDAELREIRLPVGAIYDALIGKVGKI